MENIYIAMAQRLHGCPGYCPKVNRPSRMDIAQTNKHRNTELVFLLLSEMSDDCPLHLWQLDSSQTAIAMPIKLEDPHADPLAST